MYFHPVIDPESSKSGTGEVAACKLSTLFQEPVEKVAWLSLCH